MEGMRFSALVSYAKVRRQRQHAAPAREGETAGVYRRPSGRSGAASADEWRRHRRAEEPDWRPLQDPIPVEEEEAAVEEAHPNVASVKRKKTRRSVSLMAAVARASSWIKRDLGGEPAFPTSVPWTMAF